MNRLLTTGTYDEALERLHRTGPEVDGGRSNHGPLEVEALARRGSESVVHRWPDDYARRLEAMPEARRRIDAGHWAGALGDPARLGDWIAFFRRDLREREWTEVLAEWWPRLLPGIAAGATHGVIRTGHAVHALRDEVSDARVDELAHALAYWAGRWQAVPAVHLSGRSSATSLVTGVPRVADQTGGIRDRLAQLAGTAGWHDHVARLAAPSLDDVPLALDDLVDAVVVAYPQVAHGNPTMLVHACTAPNAVARTLPSLPRTQWRASYAFAWSASAAVLAAYLPAAPVTTQPAGPRDVDADEAWQLAVGHAGEHVVKLADTALDVHARTGDPAALEAITTAVSLDA